jgi:hypothetical protein
MYLIVPASGFFALFILARHIYCAQRLELIMKREPDGLWESLGRPKPISFFYSDLQRFRSKHKEIIDGNALIHRSLTKYERSWKYGMPMILVLTIMSALLQKLFVLLG